MIMALLWLSLTVYQLASALASTAHLPNFVIYDVISQLQINEIGKVTVIGGLMIRLGYG